MLYALPMKYVKDYVIILVGEWYRSMVEINQIQDDTLKLFKEHCDGNRRQLIFNNLMNVAKVL